MKKIIAVILVICISLTGVYSPVSTVQVFAKTELEKAKEKKAQLERQLSEAQKKLESYKKEAESSTNAVDKAAAEAKVAEAEKEVLMNQLLELYTYGESVSASMQDAENEYNQKQEEFYEKSRLMYIYSCKSPLEILAESTGISDFVKRIKLILFISEEDNKIIEELEESKREYEYKKQYQEECSDIINEMLKDKELSIDNITMSKEELQSKISNAQSMISSIEEQESDIKEDLAAVDAEIKKLQAAQSSQNNSGSSGSSGSEQTKYTGGTMKWPVPCTSRISSSYGYRSDPFTGKKSLHTGIDIPAPKGSSILAAADGTVIMATTNGGYGKCVKINHGGSVITLYGHCNELLVRTGDKVKKGDLIARVGTTGRSTGNHLHFEIQKNGKHTDPMPYLKG